MRIKSYYKILFVFLVSLIISVTSNVAQQDVSISHTFSSLETYFDQTIPVAGSVLRIETKVNKANVNEMSIVLDDDVSSSKSCDQQTCKFEFFPTEGLHTYYAIVKKSDGKTEITPRTNVFFASGNCISSKIIKIIGPNNKPLYAFSNKQEVYNLEITNPRSASDSYTLSFLKAGNWKGTFSQNPITLSSGETKRISFTIEPDSNPTVATNSKFFINLISQAKGESVESSCIYYFFGNTINLEVSDGITITPNQNTISNVLIPASRTPGIVTEVRLAVQVNDDYNFLGWRINGESKSDLTISLPMNKSWNVKALSETKAYVCRGAHSLTFFPQTVLPSHASTAIIKSPDLTCDEKTIFVRDPNNVQPCSCVIGKSVEECRCEVTSPSTQGTYVYTANMLRNQDTDFNDIFFGEAESVPANLVVSPSASPVCIFSELPKKRSDNEKIYDFKVNVYNLPSELKHIKIFCDKSAPIEQIKEIIPDTVARSPTIPLACDYSFLTQLKTITIAVSGINLPECTAKITDFLPEGGASGAQIILTPGWNFISTPFSEEGTIRSRFDGFCKMGNVITIKPGTNQVQFVSFDEIKPNRGYLVKVENQCTVTFSGQLSLKTTFHNGWNTFGIGTTTSPISLSKLEERIAKTCFPPLQVNPKPFLSSIIQLNRVTKQVILNPAELRAGFGYLAKLFMATSPCEVEFKLGSFEITNTKISKEELGVIDKYTFETTISNPGDSSLTQNNFKFRVYSPQKDIGQVDGNGNPIFVRLKLCTFEVGTLTLAPGESIKRSCEYKASKAESTHTIISELTGTVYETFPSGYGDKAVLKFPELAENKITLPLDFSDIGIRFGEGIAFIDTTILYGI